MRARPELTVPEIAEAIRNYDDATTERGRRRALANLAALKAVYWHGRRDRDALSGPLFRPTRARGMSPAIDDRLDKAFVTMRKGAVFRRGIVRDHIPPNRYEVEFVSWVDGSPTTRGIITAGALSGESVTGERWHLFSTPAEADAFVASNEGETFAA